MHDVVDEMRHEEEFYLVFASLERIPEGPKRHERALRVAPENASTRELDVRHLCNGELDFRRLALRHDALPRGYYLS